MTNKYTSIYSPDKQINALQYICELLCQKKADFDNVRLPIRFWDTMPAWNRYFRKNLRKVAKLLKIYDERAIINTIKGQKFKNRYSIFTEYADNLIKQEQEKLALAQLVEHNKVERVDTTAKPRQQKTKQGILSKLDQLDSYKYLPPGEHDNRGEDHFMF